MKVVFTAIVLPEAYKSALFKAFPPKHNIVQDGHVTLAFRPGKLPDNLGEEITFEVYGYANDDKADAVAVKLFDVESNNEIPHITLSVRQGTSPVYSNELLNKGYNAVEPLTLKGVVGAFIQGQGYVFKLPEPVLPPPSIVTPPPVQPNPEIEKAPQI